MSSCVLIINYKNRNFAMSNASQIFEVMDAPADYELLISKCKRLQDENQAMRSEMEELRTRLHALTLQAEKGKEHAHNVSHLSKTLLRLGRVAMHYQEGYDCLKKQSEAAANADEVEQLHAQIEAQWAAKLAEVEKEKAGLQEKMASQLHELQTYKQQQMLLQSKLQQKDSQLIFLQQNMHEKTAHVKILQQEIVQLKDEIKEREYIVLNQRNLRLEQQSKFQEKEANIKKYQAALQAKARGIADKYEELQSLKAAQDIMIKDKLAEMEEELNNKEQALQEDYNRMVASLRDFSANDEELEQLRAQLEQAKADNMRQSKRVSKLKKELQEAIDRATYQQECYENVDNIDHSIVAIYLKNLVAFRDKLLAIGEANVAGKVSEKKEQMMKALEKELRKALNSDK